MFIRKKLSSTRDYTEKQATTRAKTKEQDKAPRAGPTQNQGINSTRLFLHIFTQRISPKDMGTARTIIETLCY